MEIQKLKTSAPGRICLFGEHQDYLHLPVITAAINLRIEIEGTKRNDRKFTFDLPDLNETDRFSFDGTVKYTKERDYLRSAFNVLVRENVNIPSGYDCTIRGKIPINSGTSSSSALIVVWIKFLLTIAEDYRADDPMEIAKLAHRAEVIEFNEPGGMMDHYATSLGGVLFIEFKNPVKVEKLKSNLGSFVLGDSEEPKDTTGILARVKDGVLDILKDIKSNGVDINLEKTLFPEIKSKIQHLSADKIALVEGALSNREVTLKAYILFHQDNIETKVVGSLLSDCQSILRDKLYISTPKLDRMINAAIDAGATGGKLNGSGGGGCMFVCAPNDPGKVAQAISHVGGKPFIIEVDEGVRLDYFH